MLLVLFTHLVRTKLNTQICRWRFQVLLALVCTHGVAKHQWWTLCSPCHEQWHCPEEAAFQLLKPSMVPPHQPRSLHTIHGPNTPTMVPPRLSGLYSLFSCEWKTNQTQARAKSSHGAQNFISSSQIPSLFCFIPFILFLVGFSFEWIWSWLTTQEPGHQHQNRQ